MENPVSAPPATNSASTSTPTAPAVTTDRIVAEPVSPPAKKSPKLLIALGAVVLVLAIVAGIYLSRSKPLPPTIQDDHGTMVLVPAGTFVFGENAPDSPHPRQTVTLPAFYIDQTEVSNAEYLRFIQATGRPFSAQAFASEHPRDPATNVSYQDAAAYAAWAGKRLPTDQEWEKAARGTDGRPYPWGSDPWNDNVPTELQPVDSFPDRKSPFGALNMAGNAWEWTATAYHPDERELADMGNVLKTDSFSRTWYNFKGGSFSPNGSFFFRVYLTRGFPEDQKSPVIGFPLREECCSGNNSHVPGELHMYPITSSYQRGFVLFAAVIFAGASAALAHAQQSSARNVFWSASDLVQVSENPGAKPASSDGPSTPPKKASTPTTHMHARTSSLNSSPKTAMENSRSLSVFPMNRSAFAMRCSFATATATTTRFRQPPSFITATVCG